jgi:hypothetical protein
MAMCHYKIVGWGNAASLAVLVALFHSCLICLVARFCCCFENQNLREKQNNPQKLCEMEARTLENSFRVVALAKLEPESLMPQCQALSFASETNFDDEFTLLEVPPAIADQMEKVFFNKKLLYKDVQSRNECSLVECLNVVERSQNFSFVEL